MSSKSPDEPTQTSDEIKIIVDNRELRSRITKALKEFEVTLEAETLDVADYILSDRVGVEAKTADDFVQSIIDRRLFSQLQTLRDTFAVPLLLITGPSLYGASRINPAAIRGALSSAIVDFQVPVINVVNATEAASLLYIIARQEQSIRKRIPSIRGKKPALSMAALQEYIIAGLPGINITLAKRLLHQFGSINGVFHATSEELASIHGIGKIKAQTIRETLDAPYEAEK